MNPPRTVIVFGGYTVLCSAPDGSIDGDRQGLFDYDTRILAKHRLSLAGSEPELISFAQPESDRWEATLRVRRPGGSPEGPILPQDALELNLRRRVGPGMLESIGVRNHSAVACRTELRLDLGADFADVAEIRRERRQTGKLRRRSDGSDRQLEFAYTATANGRTLDRALRVRVLEAGGEATFAGTEIVLALDLPPRGAWAATLRYESLVDGSWRFPEGFEGDPRSLERGRRRRSRLRTEGDERLRLPFERAADDLFSLRNGDLEAELLGGKRGWILNAGVPTFTGFFGRDTLTAGWQSALLGTEALRGALAVAAATQATTDDASRDAEPGKMIHEMRRGPLAMLGIGPREAYYGTQTTPAMFVLGLSELWHWTADTAALRRYRDAALRTFEWADTSGDRDGDGFLEYERRAPSGLRNQGWKDSDEAIRHADGAIAEGPLATVEEQAFHFLALQRMAEILLALDETDRAEDFLARADDLKRRWHEAFWMADERFYALALDGTKRQVRSITSNPGHALGTGIVPDERARDVADRLLAPDLFSGWGIRTLSADHPSFNPFAYHLGAVWPVENATFALGFRRYGLDDHLDRLAEAILEAAGACPDQRLPEALSGHDRASSDRPIFYPDANSPQAWSASAVIQVVQIMLGLYPFAPLRLLALVRPRLPAWLPELELRNVHIGHGRLDLHFRRRRDGSAAWSARQRRGGTVVLEVGPPSTVGDHRRTLSEIAKQAAIEHAPGRLARAARIALGIE